MRYLKVFKSLVNLSTKRYLENRFAAVSYLMASIIALLIMIVIVDTIFSYVNAFNGWSKDQVLVLVGSCRIVLAIFSMLFVKSINYLNSYIRQGDLDGLLLKPINTQFLVSFRQTRIIELIDVFAGVFVVYYGLSQLNFNFSMLDLLLLIMNLTMGIIILYSIYFSLACLTFWLGTFYSLNSIYYMITSPLSLPTNIYSKGISLLITYILPLGFIVFIPVSIFLEREYYLTIFEILFAIGLLIFSKWFWNFSLRHYTSASS